MVDDWKVMAMPFSLFVYLVFASDGTGLVSSSLILLYLSVIAEKCGVKSFHLRIKKASRGMHEPDGRDTLWLLSCRCFHVLRGLLCVVCCHHLLAAGKTPSAIIAADLV